LRLFAVVYDGLQLFGRKDRRAVRPAGFGLDLLWKQLQTTVNHRKQLQTSGLLWKQLQTTVNHRKQLQPSC